MKCIVRHRTKLSQAIGFVYILAFTFSEKKLKTIAPALIGAMSAAGIILVGSAIVGRLWCAEYIAGRKTESLVTDGPYSVCRNPLYFFSLIGGTGVGLCTGSLILATIIPAVFAVIYPAAILSEERILQEAHGEAFDDYVSKVPRFFPKWSLFREPAQYTANTKIFRREMLDTLCFAYIVGLFEMIMALVDGGVIKAFFALY